MNLLFVCSKNKWRSPTAAKIWQRREGFNTRSAGTARAARHQINSNDIQWADVIFVMEQKHKSRIREGFRRAANHKTIHVLDIPDEYQFMDSELIDLLGNAVEAYL